MINQASARLGELGTGFDHRSDTLAGATARAVADMNAAGQVFSRRAQDLTSATETGAARVDAFGDAFRRLAEEITLAVSQAASRIQSVGESFDRTTRGLNLASEQAQEKLGAAERRLAEETRLLTTASDRSTSEARAAATLFQNQATALVTASSTARAEAERLASNELTVKRASFLRASRLIVDSLNSLAIDFSRTLDPTLSERLLRDFIGGDRGVFVRRLLRLSFGEAEGKIRDRYRDDSEFRRYADEYLMQFDRVLNEAKEVDPENILSATFLTADVGKLYLVLSTILGRNKAA
jgi:hypothetical protein